MSAAWFERLLALLRQPASQVIIGRLTLIAVVLVVGIMFDGFAAAAVAVIAIAVTGLIEAFHLQRLFNWAATSVADAVPFGFGAWQWVLDRISRSAHIQTGERDSLRTELNTIQSAVHQAPIAMILLDRYNLVEWANRMASDLFPLVRERLPVHLMVRHPAFSEYLSGWEADSRDRPLVLELQGKSGSTLELRLLAASEHRKLLVARDITRESRLDELRTDFVANVSHEIRTPVTVIRGFAETLLDIEFSRDQTRQYLSNIHLQSLSLQTLIDDLLLLSSLEHSQSPPESRPIAVDKLLQTLCDEGNAISRGNHQIRWHASTNCQFQGEPAEIESAVRNLVTNAIRYTPKGRSIELSWSRREDTGVIAVRDEGIGVAAEHIPRLTERFFRVDRSRSRETGGTGLGLAIVKHIAQRHQLLLEVESNLGVGSKFSLVVPASRLVEVPEP